MATCCSEWQELYKCCRNWKFDIAEKRAYKGLSLLPAISRQSQHLHTEVIQFVDDLLQTGQVVAADWAVLATVHNNQLPLAGGGTDLNHTALQLCMSSRQMSQTQIRLQTVWRNASGG